LHLITESEDYRLVFSILVHQGRLICMIRISMNDI